VTASIEFVVEADTHDVVAEMRTRGQRFNNRTSHTHRNWIIERAKATSVVDYRAGINEFTGRGVALAMRITSSLCAILNQYRLALLLDNSAAAIDMCQAKT
jgi:hypothetical protein